MKYRILEKMKSSNYEMIYNDPFTGKEFKGDKATAQQLCFMLICQFEDEEFRIEEIK
jgi:hypothetical protein